MWIFHINDGINSCHCRMIELVISITVYLFLAILWSYLIWQKQTISINVLICYVFKRSQRKIESQTMHRICLQNPILFPICWLGYYGIHLAQLGGDYQIVKCKFSLVNCCTGNQTFRRQTKTWLFLWTFSTTIIKRLGIVAEICYSYVTFIAYWIEQVDDVCLAFGET